MFCALLFFQNLLVFVSSVAIIPFLLLMTTTNYKVIVAVICLSYISRMVSLLFSPAIVRRSQTHFRNKATVVLHSSGNYQDKELLSLLGSIQKRGASSENADSINLNKRIEELVSNLENTFDGRKSKYLDGCWKLLYTSTPGTNSPIQRTFTAIESVSIFQVVNIYDTSASFLKSDIGEPLPDVSNTVCFFFGNDSVPLARLRVTALASTSSRPLIVPRIGDGKIFGMNIFGVSKSNPPRNPEERIDFAFQEAQFEFRNFPFTIPYPVPFKLLGDEAKGWIDNTYISEQIRIARGNKGTLFLLQKVSTATDPAAAFAVSKLKELKKLESDKKKAQRQKNSSRPLQRVAIIFPAQLSTAEDYEELSASIEKLSFNGIRCYAAPLSRIDWPAGLLPSFFSKEYFVGALKPVETLAFYLKRIDEAVALALNDHGDKDVEISLVGHSIGGWIARAWLSEWCAPAVRDKVRSVVTLGSPHNPPPSDSLFAKFDQTRGLLSHINSNYPGAYESNVKYTSVIGSEVTGDLNIFKTENLLAYVSYLFLCGEGPAGGDGIIPVATSQLPGATDVVLDGVRHSNFVPTIQKSLKLPVKWYGSSDVVEQWIDCLNSS